MLYIFKNKKIRNILKLIKNIKFQIKRILNL